MKNSDLDCTNGKKWYKIECYLGHQRTRKGVPTTNYVYVKDAVEALMKFKKMDGTQKSIKGVIIKPIKNKETIENLEKVITDTPNVTFRKAKRENFYGTRIGIGYVYFRLIIE